MTALSHRHDPRASDSVVRACDTIGKNIARSRDSISRNGHKVSTRDKKTIGEVLLSVSQIIIVFVLSD